MWVRRLFFYLGVGVDVGDGLFLSLNLFIICGIKFRFKYIPIYPVTHKSSDGYVKRQGYKLALFRGGGVQSL